MNSNFTSTIEDFTRHTVLIIGEAFLDGYFHGFTQRISREAPVPIVDIQQKTYAPGGAANVAANVAALKAKSIFLSVTGNDLEGTMLKHALDMFNVNTNFMIADTTRKTIAKKRVFADNHMLVRFDYGSEEKLSKQTEIYFIEQIITLWEKVDTVIISDYNYGIITENVIEILKKLQENYPKTFVIDSKYLDRFKNVPATAVKPNYLETVALLGLSKIERGQKRINQIEQYKQDLFKKLHTHIATVTLDSDGALIFDKHGPVYRTYADKVENPKVAGAGDTYTAALSLCLATGSDIKEAAEIAESATKVIIRKQGTAICSKEELQSIFYSNDKFIASKKALKALITTYNNQGKKIVFSNGCFDIIHSGHVAYLSKAKSFGDIFIVGVNTDESIKQLKGPTRPINSLQDRMRVLSALSCIDYVVPMPEKTAVNLIQLIRPDVYVKGADYTVKTLPEAKYVFKYGGKVELLPTIKGKSTTRIIQQIQEADSIKGMPL